MKKDEKVMNLLNAIRMEGIDIEFIYNKFLSDLKNNEMKEQF